MLKNSTHTSGPWTLIEKSWQFEIPEIHIVFGCSHSTDPDDDRDIKSSEQGQVELGNARLIAAAPELLEALESLLRGFDSLMPGLAHIAVQDYALINEAPIRARAAIRKAKEGI